MAKFENETVTKTIRFEKDMADKVEKIAKENFRDFSSQVRFIIEKYIKTIEK